jgi:hypothetical protein
MKKISKLILALCFISGFFSTSCTKDSGNTPAITRSSLLGTWLENDSGKKGTYEVIFQADTSATGILIVNFGGCGQNMKAIAYLSGSTLALNTNELLGNGWIINGSGTVTGSTLINWPYSLHDGATLTNFQATFTKK